MALSAFQNLVHIEQANLHVAYSQMIDTTDFVSRQWIPNLVCQQWIPSLNL